jgi:MFS transporter, SP family, arabinose:H+ symporter
MDLKQSLDYECQYDRSRVWLKALNASIGYLIFGYVNGIFTSSQACLSSLLGWGESERVYIALISACIPLGGLCGAIFTGALSEKLGKRKGIMMTDIIMIISSMIGLIPRTWTLFLGRFSSGFCIGSFSMLCPQYITDFTPKDVTGKLGSFNNLFIISGLMSAFSVCLLLPTGECSEEIEYTVFSIFLPPGVLATLQFLIFLYIFKNESPSWLASHGYYNLALRSWSSIYNPNYAEKLLLEYNLSNEEGRGCDPSNSQDSNSLEKPLLFRKVTTKAIKLSLLYHMITQFSGINAILAYMTSIFQGFGVEIFTSRLLNVAISFSRILAILFVMPLMDKMGRKTITVMGELSLGICAGILGLLGTSNIVLIPVLLMGLYLIIFGISVGSFVWIFSSEVLTDTQMCLCTSINWLCGLVVVLCFPFLVDFLGISLVFILLAGINIAGFVYFAFNMIETKGLKKCQIRAIYSRY